MPKSRGLRTGIAVAVSTSCLVGGLALGLAQSSAALAAVPNATATVSVPVGMSSDSPEVTAIQAREDALAIVSRRVQATSGDTAAADSPASTPSSVDAAASAGSTTEAGADEYAIDGDYGDADSQVQARQQALLDTEEQVTAEATRLAALGKFFFPAVGKVGSPWGMRLHPILHIWRMHDGVDIGAACGTPIWSTLPGTVIESTSSSSAGLHVKVDHGMVGGKHLVTSYLHMSKIEAQVGDVVGRGQEIGRIGSTGLSTECHLHLALWVNGTNVNPVPFLNA